MPRPETEVVAGWAIEAVLERVGSVAEQPVVVDLCTGSGAIALAVKSEVPAARVLAVEVSDLAVAWAQRNRDRLALDVEIEHADAVTALPELTDVDVDEKTARDFGITAGAVLHLVLALRGGY